MNIKDYLHGLTPQEREGFAIRLRALGALGAEGGELRTSIAYLALLKGGHRKPPPGNCRLYVEASNGVLTLEELRPDVFGKQVA